MPLTADYSQLTKSTENLGGGTTTQTGLASMATVTTRSIGFADPATNQVQLLTVDASAGSYSLSFHVGPVLYTTAPIPYNANAEQLRRRSRTRSPSARASIRTCGSTSSTRST